jgi:hypothetical protein
MSNQIYEICENFNFNNLKLDNPTLLNANIYFSKLNSNLNKNFYVQLPKCKTKQGIVNATSKCFCDLEFNSSDKLIVEFFENLENYFIKEICNNKSLWFYDSDSISNDDINDFINPIMRSYKGGKKFLIKANIKQEKINIYDENEKKLSLAEYDCTNDIIPLLNINGIRFSKSSFIIDIILVQFMVLYPCDSLENQILIKINKNKEEPLENNSEQHSELTEANKEIQSTEKLIQSTEKLIMSAEKVIETTKEIESEKVIEASKSINTSKSSDSNSFKFLMNNLETNQDYGNNNTNDDCALEVTELDAITENSVPIELKSHESIYLEIYRKAKQKAKEIRRNAIEAFLEAKNIKLKYNLASIVSDSSSDDES